MTLPAPDFQTRIRCLLTASFSAAFASAFARSATSDSGAPSGTVSSNSTRNSMPSSLRRLDYEYSRRRRAVVLKHEIIEIAVPPVHTRLAGLDDRMAG